MQLVFVLPESHATQHATCRKWLLGVCTFILGVFWESPAPFVRKLMGTQPWLIDRVPIHWEKLPQAGERFKSPVLPPPVSQNQPVFPTLGMVENPAKRAVCLLQPKMSTEPPSHPNAPPGVWRTQSDQVFFGAQNWITSFEGPKSLGTVDPLVLGVVQLKGNRLKPSRGQRPSSPRPKKKRSRPTN